MTHNSRRAFLKTTARFALTTGFSLAVSRRLAEAAERKMRIAFTPGSIGVKANQRESIDLAHHFGFEAVQPFAADLARLSSDELRDLLGELKAKRLEWAAAGLSVDFRRDEAAFREGLRKFPEEAEVLERAGVTRIGTWIMPTHDSLTYRQNFRQTARRLRTIATIAGHHGLRLGLEYVGTKTLWSRDRYPFIHTMAETKELIAEIGRPNVGFVLDTWHWWTAGESETDILTLRNEDVVSCDLNDAPAGIPKDQQIDGQRELPAATGVIDVKAFLNALNKIGYDGPVRPEPFNEELRNMTTDEACAATIQAMQKAFALID